MNGGWKHSPEARARISKAVKRQWKDPEYRARQSEQARRWWDDPEHRALAREAGL